MSTIEKFRRLAAQNGLQREIADALIELASEAARHGVVTTTTGPAMTVDQAGDELGCGRTKVFQLLETGVLKPAPKAGRHRMVLRSSVEAFINSGATP